MGISTISANNGKRGRKMGLQRQLQNFRNDTLIRLLALCTRRFQDGGYRHYY